MITWLSLLFSLVFLIHSINDLMTGNYELAVFDIIVAIFLGLLFLGARHSKQQQVLSTQFINWLAENNLAIQFSGAHYNGILIH